MEGREVNELQKLENRGEEDKQKTDGNLSVKLSVFSVAIHNMECSRLPPEPDVGDQYSWVPFPCNNFVDLLIDAFFVTGQDRSKTFLEIGCGIGTKVMLADVLFDASGFDIEEEYLDTARKIGCKKVFAADAMDFEGYGDYDVLYYYAPFKEEVLQKRFENRLYAQMKPGQVLAPMHTMTMWHRYNDMTPHGRYLFVKEAPIEYEMAQL